MECGFQKCVGTLKLGLWKQNPNFSLRLRLHCFN